MKKKLLCVTIAAIISVMTACGSGSSDSPTTSEPTKVGATPTEATVAEPTKVEEPEVEPTEEIEPTPEPVVEGPNVFKGIDLTNFIEGTEGNFWADLESNTFDKLAWVVSMCYGSEVRPSVRDVALDGDSVEAPEGSSLLSFMLYTPKRVNSVDEISIKEGNLIFIPFGDTDESGKKYSKNAYRMTFADQDAVRENDPVSINVTYDDGTSESITIYVTHK